MIHVRPTVEQRRQLQFFVERFDSLPDRGWLLNNLQTTSFRQLYRTMLRPSYLDYYHLTMDELGSMISSKLNEAARLTELPLTDNTTQQSLLDNALTLLRDDLDLSEVEKVGNVLIPVILGIKVRTVNIVSFFRYGEFPKSMIDYPIFLNDDAVLRLVKLDSVFLTEGFGADFIRKAEIDRSLKSRLSEALAPDRKFWSVKRERRTFIFFLFHRLKIPGRLLDWYFLAQDLDLDHFKSQDAFERAARRAFQKLRIKRTE